MLTGCGEPSSSEVEAALRDAGFASLGKPKDASCAKRGKHWDCAASLSGTVWCSSPVGGNRLIAVKP
jgi:hypothetical protein